MARIKLKFDNADGQTLAGLLEFPPDGVPVARYALFAHCFTCGKDIAAASRISHAMASRGIAVLRFDFTGLGKSDGDFANTKSRSRIDVRSTGRWRRRCRSRRLRMNRLIRCEARTSSTSE